MAKRHVGSVSFSITGDFLTQHFRSLVREGNWRDAVEGLCDSLMSDSHDDGEVMLVVHQILAGKKKLIGTNSLGLEDDDAFEDPDFISQQYSIYAKNIIIDEGKLFEGYGYVKVLEENDFLAAMVMPQFEYMDSSDAFSLTRDFAAAKLERSGDISIYDDSRNAFLMMRPAKPDYPAWLDKKTFMKLCGLLSYYSLFDYGDSYQFEIEQEKVSVAKRQAMKFESRPTERFFKKLKPVEPVCEDTLRAKVKAQADSCGGWITLHNEKLGKSYTIPRNPFMRWAMGPTRSQEDRSKFPWNPVSPSGMKMPMDSSMHSDFWLFTGIPFEDAYEEDNEDVAFFTHCRFRYYTGHSGISNSLMPLANGTLRKNVQQALVIHVSSPQEMATVSPTMGMVIVIPQAGPDYEPIARKCAESGVPLIAETGGKLCHLATVGREMGLKLFMLPNAREHLPDRLMINIDAESLKAEIAPFDDEKARKLSGNLVQ